MPNLPINLSLYHPLERNAQATSSRQFSKLHHVRTLPLYFPSLCQRMSSHTTLTITHHFYHIIDRIHRVSERESLKEESENKSAVLLHLPKAGLNSQLAILAI